MPIPHRRACLLPLALLLCACPTTGGGADDDDTEAPTPAPRPGPEYSGGTCPTLVEGMNEGFSSAGLDRSFILLLPDEPAGAPVVFTWHWLGGEADQILEYAEFDALPDEGAIVISPVSSGSQFEWAFLSDPEDNIDLQFFEDMLSCVHAQYTVDMDRIFATGMSAGGLWTSYLTIHGSAWLASTAPMSGGASEDVWVPPVRALPVMLTWGGPTDYAVGFDFHTANQTFSELLQGRGSFVTECEHNGGHTIPNGARDTIWRWFEDHPMNAEDEAYEDGLPGSFPGYCSIPE
jgi:poly(3-hydroxybutyrate) depolymerase